MELLAAAELLAATASPVTGGMPASMGQRGGQVGGLEKNGQRGVRQGLDGKAPAGDNGEGDGGEGDDEAEEEAKAAGEDSGESDNDEEFWRLAGLQDENGEDEDEREDGEHGSGDDEDMDAHTSALGESSDDDGGDGDGGSDGGSDGGDGNELGADLPDLAAAHIVRPTYGSERDMEVLRAADGRFVVEGVIYLISTIN